MKTPTKPEKSVDEKLSMDDVLRRMLATPPTPHVEKKPKKKPSAKARQKAK